MSKPIIYTIGHSTHRIEYFLDLLNHYKVNCVIDVRSMPASRFNPQYNKKSLTISLNSNGVDYLHFGDAFGARQTDPRLLDKSGKVDFEKVRNTGKFKDSISRVSRETEAGKTIALMCSEAEPLSCHRFVMISVALKDFEVRHILKDKSIVSQQELECRLMENFSKKSSQATIFWETMPFDEKLREAYQMMNKEIGYMRSQQKSIVRK
jgi:uncharacterized protein (DUF488 family)